MRLLIADFAWRSRWRAAFLGPMVLGLTWMACAIGDPARGVPFSMAMVFGLGPQTSLQQIPRALWYLPVARREIWRAGWLVAVIGTTLVTLAAKILAMLAFQFIPSLAIAGELRAPLGVWGLLLSSLYDLLAAGCGCAVATLTTRPPAARAPWRHASSVLIALAQSATTWGFVAAMYGGALMRRMLPIQRGDVTARTGAGLLAALAVILASYFHVPSPPALANRGATPARRNAARSVIRLAGPSGMPGLLANEYSHTMKIAGGAIAASVIVVVLGAAYLHASNGLADLLRTELLLFGGTAAPAPALGFTMFALVVWYVFFIATQVARFPEMLRHLRVLPISVARLNVLLVAWPSVIWVTVWAALFTLHVAVTGHMLASYHLALFAAVCGLSALVQTLTLRVVGVLRVFWFSIAIFPVPLLPLIAAPSAAALALFGVSALVASAVLNQIAVRRTSTYRTMGFVIGVARM